MDHLHAARAAAGPLIVAAAPSAPPFTTPALTANLVCRVVLALAANAVCLVPLRLLYRGGELAAVVFIVNMELRNTQTLLYALLWRDDNFDAWWPGYGLCDLHPYFTNFSLTLYGTCLLAMMRNLSRQVGLMRVGRPSGRERRRRNLVQALIMFPLPVSQVILTWFLTAGRYAVGTVIGCAWLSDDSWLYLVFIILPPMIVSTLTVVYAVLTYKRYREASRGSDAILSRNRLASHRAQRARRRLYLMVVSILAPYYPIVMAIGAFNIVDNGALKPYDYAAMHSRTVPYPWNTIIYLPSSTINFGLMNIGWISILTAIPIFLFFGKTTDAVNSYRRLFLHCGLDAFFPGLHREYDPDRPLRYAVGGSSGSNTSASNTTPTLTSTIGSSAFKFKTMSVTRTLGSLSSTSGDTAVDHDAHVSSPLSERPLLRLGNPFLFRTRPDPTTASVWSRLFSRSSRPVVDEENQGVQRPSSASRRQGDPTMPGSEPGIPLDNIHTGGSSSNTRIWGGQQTSRDAASPSPPPNALLGTRHSDENLHGVRVDTMLICQTYQDPSTARRDFF